MTKMACELILAGHPNAWGYSIDIFLASYKETASILKEKQKKE